MKYEPSTRSHPVESSSDENTFLRIEELMQGAFASRHIGPRAEDIRDMVGYLGLSSLDDLVDRTIPASIRQRERSSSNLIGTGRTESEILEELRELAAQNQLFRSFIGQGYSGCITPQVIVRNVLEDPRWYTPYTPYQAEAAQGRLDALLNFQTMVADLTGLEIANASLLDEATAAAEAMAMSEAIKGKISSRFFVSNECHPQTIEVVKARALPIEIDVVVGDHRTVELSGSFFGALLQYPATDGSVYDYTEFIEHIHGLGGLVTVSADILSLALLKPPGEFGTDIAIGTTQRFGVPLGYGGPHAAYIATRDIFKRHLPGRLVGVSRDAEGRSAVRLALQTREQHIRRDKATSNICTAQALLAVAASMYAIYHGPEGILSIASDVAKRALHLAEGIAGLGHSISPNPFFDTVRVNGFPETIDAVESSAHRRRINLRRLQSGAVCIALDETTSDSDVAELIEIFAENRPRTQTKLRGGVPTLAVSLRRTSPFLTHPVFNTYRSETEMLRFLNHLANRDLSLATSMIPLGSCTMKLNAAAEMAPITWPEFSQIHPFVPADQAMGYRTLIDRLEKLLAEITGFTAVSLQPNAGSQGEYAGLLVIHRYHAKRGEAHRNICLIPNSAHGTNPASAVMAGMKIVPVATDRMGNVDIDDLRTKAMEHADDLAALMITYPSTHGVFEEGIREICDIVHDSGGQVYMDGANMNAQVGICRPGDYGPDVCHLNLHKTFCIPHGGGGPGMGPIGVAAHLADYLPGHPVIPTGGAQAIGPVAAAPWGSPGILPIPYAYIRLMGAEGLALATAVAILNANYVAHRLEEHFPILYRGDNGFVAHECILDVRTVKATSGIEVEDIAKRLMDYGFHAPTVSFPVPGTMMIEPTESESKEELDRFCDAMAAIRAEIRDIEEGRADRVDNPLKNAPHTASSVCGDDWPHSYSRTTAAFPNAWIRANKYWPPVARIDSVYGDRNIICSCPPMESYH